MFSTAGRWVLSVREASDVQGTHQPNSVPSCAAAVCPSIPSGSGYGSHPGPSTSGFHVLPTGDTFHSGIGRKRVKVRR